MSVGLCADANLLQLYSSGVISGDCCTDIDHGVLAVGYGVDDDSGLAYYKIKNSWGESWGEEGFFRIARVDDGVGECALLTYLTTVEVADPTCNDSSFCNSNGTATVFDDDISGGEVSWGCECECASGLLPLLEIPPGLLMASLPRSRTRRPPVPIRVCK